MFLGTLSGHDEPARPRMLGARMQFMPLDGLEIGWSRVIQWGGAGRSESASQLWKAIVGDDNMDNGGENPSNQLGGFDLRWTRRIAATQTASVYLQGIGEDEAGGLPSRYMVSVGFDLAYLDDHGSARFVVEHADTVAGDVVDDPLPGIAYRHSTYQQGYSQRGRPIGFPAGGDVTLTSVGLLVQQSRFSLVGYVHLGQAREGAQFFTPGRIGGVDATFAWQLDAQNQVGASVDGWRAPGVRTQRLQLWWRRPLH